MSWSDQFLQRLKENAVRLVTYGWGLHPIGLRQQL
jgi:hypothetical protein